MLAHRPVLSVDLANSEMVVLEVLTEFERLRDSVYTLVGDRASKYLPFDAFKQHLFFLTGFSQAIEDRILGMVCLGGGQRHLFLTSDVTLIFAGERADLDYLAELPHHPSGAQCAKVSWLLSKLKPLLLSTIDKCARRHLER